jgi:hypothetical protein
MRKLAKRLVLSAALLGVASAIFFFARPIWWEWRAQRLISQITQAERQANPDGYRELFQFLDDKKLSKDIGDRALAAIIRPRLHAREAYPIGRHVVASVETCCDAVFGNLVLDYSSSLTVGNEVIREFAGQGSLRSGGGANFEISRGLRPDGQVVPVSEAGQYRSRIVLQYRLLPPGPSEWRWPTEAPFPQNLWPRKIYLNRGKRIEGVPVYECKFELPVNFRVASRSELKRVGLVSNSDLDRQMREAFQAQKGAPGPGPGRLRSQQSSKFSPGTNTSVPGMPGPRPPVLRDGIRISFKNLPADVALRAKFRDASGRESMSAHFGFPRKAGEWGTIWMLDMYDLFETFAPGQYKGELILFTDEDVAYENPSITNVWSGTLTFPIEFTVEAPKTNGPSRR